MQHQPLTAPQRRVVHETFGIRQRSLRLEPFTSEERIVGIAAGRVSKVWIGLGG